MNLNDITFIPENYKQAVKKELQGTVVDLSYSVGNYINSERQFVTTDPNIDDKEAGREVVSGNPISKKCNVYLPAGYDANDTKIRYNVLYLLHGVGGNRFEWLYGSGSIDGNHVICNILDNLIASGEVEPLIVVFPDGRSAHDWEDSSFNPHGTNLLGFYYFDYELRYDLIPFIESQFNTYAYISETEPEKIAKNRIHRAIAGLSMGGMQSLNLVLGGYRYDSVTYTGTQSQWKNGLDATVLVPGMMDLFAYVGAFSNAPTSSGGEILGASLLSSKYKLPLLYITCGDADGVAFQAGYSKSIEKLLEIAGENLSHYYRILIKNANHDFTVWNNGTYNFLRLCFKKEEEYVQPINIEKVLG